VCVQYTLKFKKYEIDLMTDVYQSTIAAWKCIIIVCYLQEHLLSGIHTEFWGLHIEMDTIIGFGSKVPIPFFQGHHQCRCYSNTDIIRGALSLRNFLNHPTNSKTLAGICMKNRTTLEIPNEKHSEIEGVWSKVRLLQGGFTLMPEWAMNKVA
jgi:hypothetical protein